MSNTVIKIDSLSKQYRLGTVGAGTLRGDFQRWTHKIRGKEDPFLKIGQENDLYKAEGEYVWALKDINLEVQEGEVLGIIGKNGAGKSTLLKILSRVTGPTTGSVNVKGRIASLLEVGTGFHPELTGRENIFLNGAIMGMDKSEIKSKLDEIVEFAGVRKYIDTPVKRYSSGMHVRLAFSVAAHLEPDILIVDEVLAVGDAEFQKKAIGKMQDISKGKGRTVLFVSHNMAAIKGLCNRLICLENGAKFYEGTVVEGINEYLQNGNSEITTDRIFSQTDNIIGNENIQLHRIKVEPLNGDQIDIESGLKIMIDFYNFKENSNIDCTIELSTFDETIVFHQGVVITTNRDSKRKNYIVEAIILSNILNSGRYKIKLIFGESQRYLLFMKEDVFTFEVRNTHQGVNFHKVPGVIRPNIEWKICQ
ncbi:MAG: ABC transporter ATP-binding protein [Bacteroidales bacterium]|nr:ABC transporter ATP-binding protein [Bacteroidales bacterium]